MTSSDGPTNLVFDFDETGAEPPNWPLIRDLASLLGTWPTTKLLLDVREVGEALGCGKTYVYELIARGELRTVKLGRLTRIPAGAVAEFVCRKLGSNPGSICPRQSSDAPFTEGGLPRNRETHATDARLIRRDRQRP